MLLAPGARVTLPAPDLHELAAAVTALERAVLDRPLAFWRAWDRPAPRTSQRRALALCATSRTVIVLGGNRTGKTSLFLAFHLALAMGSDHPDARDFWTGNGMNPDDFPRGPDRVWIVALRAADSLEYHRDSIVNLLPRVGPDHPASGANGCWAAWGLEGKDEARIEIAVPGYDPSRPSGRAEIVFKSDKPGADAFQGASPRGIHHDEESELHGSATWDEADARLTDKQGWHTMANTFLRGKTWPHRRWVQAKEPGAEVAMLYAADNPYLPPDAVERLSKNPKLARARLYGEAVAIEGQVYPFDRAAHVVPFVPIPVDWPRFRTIDFGTRHPFACVWLATARSRLELPDGRHIPDGSIVAYREHYVAEQVLSWHVRQICEAEGWVWTAADPATGRRAGWARVEGTERIAMTWVDPEDAQQMLQLVTEHQLDVVPANKARRMGTDAVCEEMAPHRVDGLPRLYFMTSCPNTIREHENLIRPPESERLNASELPIRKDDHACDCVRYGVVGIREWFGRR
jgi:hypothetical protein